MSGLVRFGPGVRNINNTIIARPAAYLVCAKDSVIVKFLFFGFRISRTEFGLVWSGLVWSGALNLALVI